MCEPGRDEPDSPFEERELLGRRWRGELDAAPVSDPVAPRELADLRADRPGVGRREMRASPVEALVLRQELWPVPRQALEEVLLRPRLEVERVRPDAARARLAGRAHDCLELLGR